jgi:protease-4
MIKKFFRGVWRLFSGLMRVLQVMVFFAFFLVFIMIFLDKSESGAAGGMPDSAALVIAPSGMLVEQISGDTLDMALLKIQGGASGQVIVSEIVQSLQAAALDDRIKLVVLQPNLFQGGGLSKLQAIGDALDEFRASGKPVIAMANGYDQSQYYLAAHADEIHMHDFGLVMIEGFGYFKTYFADAIENLKVDVNVFRVGEFKSFVEPYLRNDMSEEDKVAAERWLNALWTAYQRDVTVARGLDSDAIENYTTNIVGLLSNAGGDAAQAALEAGLVDELTSYQEFRDYITEIVGANPDQPDTFQGISYQRYLAQNGLSSLSRAKASGNVGIIVASGNIVDGESSSGTIGGITLSRLVRQAALDDSISAVVLRVDSPGGSMFASEIVLDQLQELKKTGKPLVASMSSVAASGGYYISMPADEIWAADTTISGSIGVGAIMTTFQRSLESVGVTIDGIGTTPLSGQLSGVRELNDTTRKLINMSVESAYDVFISRVAEARNMDRDQVNEIARGRVWIGSDALQVGLVDSIGGLDDAVAAAANLAGLDETEYGIKYVKRELSFVQEVLIQYASMLGGLFGEFDASESSVMLKRILTLFAEPIAMLNVWNDPRGIYMHCFCELD